jgi:PAS domain S-box-containing protein
MLGYRAEEVRGQPLSLVQADAAAHDAFQKQLARAAGSPFVRRVFTHALKHKNGNAVPAECCVAPLEDEHGHPAGWVWAVCDITRRVEAEKAVRQSQERHRRIVELWLDSVGVEAARTAELHSALRRAQEVDKLKSQLLSTVSHELRTPLTSIRGQTSTLLDYADQIGPEERAEALRIIDHEAARLDELIGHVLDMSRLESGTLHVEPVATDLRPVLAEAVELMTAQAPEHHLALNMLDKLPLAQADPRRVMQIVRNLIDNAIKFSRPGTTVTVTAIQQDKQIIVSVQDQGAGISREHWPRIFDRFYRIEHGSIRAAGVGLGLAISKGLVEAMGGQIIVDSRVGQGSTFSFTLRAVEQAAERPA